MDELLKRVNRYSKKCIAERTDDDFADALEEMKNTLMAFGVNAYGFASVAYEREIEVAKLKVELEACRNELCLHCGRYKKEHLGYCDGCRWKDGW